MLCVSCGVVVGVWDFYAVCFLWCSGWCLGLLCCVFLVVYWLVSGTPMLCFGVVVGVWDSYAVFWCSGWCLGLLCGLLWCSGWFLGLLCCVLV